MGKEKIIGPKRTKFMKTIKITKLHSKKYLFDLNKMNFNISKT